MFDVDRDRRREMILGSSFIKWFGWRIIWLWCISDWLSSVVWSVTFFIVSESWCTHEQNGLYVGLCLFKLIIGSIWISLTLYDDIGSSKLLCKYIKIALFVLCSFVDISITLAFFYVELNYVSLVYRNVAGCLILVHAMHNFIWEVAMMYHYQNPDAICCTDNSQTGVPCLNLERDHYEKEEVP